MLCGRFNDDVEPGGCSVGVKMVDVEPGGCSVEESNMSEAEIFEP